MTFVQRFEQPQVIVLNSSGLVDLRAVTSCLLVGGLILLAWWCSPFGDPEFPLDGCWNGESHQPLALGFEEPAANADLELDAAVAFTVERNPSTKFDGTRFDNLCERVSYLWEEPAVVHGISLAGFLRFRNTEEAGEGFRSYLDNYEDDNDEKFGRIHDKFGRMNDGVRIRVYADSGGYDGVALVHYECLVARAQSSDPSFLDPFVALVEELAEIACT